MGTVFYNFRVDLLPFRFCKLLQSLYNSVRNCPTQKVQLPDRRRETLKLDTFRPTKWIEKFFTVPVQTGLVCYVYSKDLAIRSRKGHVICL